MMYRPNFDKECHICGTSPTVIVVGHMIPDTNLCGPHFFSRDGIPDRRMIEWEDWNNPPESTE